MRQKIQPYRGNTRRHGHALFIDQCRQRRSIAHLVTGHDHFGAGHGAGVGVTPSVNVEHGNNRQDNVAR